ncbi:MAG: peptidoglycan editing factor PgeF [Chlamydiae bacterium]|nr:peptidoglycan editing factor PgeF [Chlamydiota bacterium]
MQLHKEGSLRWLSFELLDDAGLINAVILKPFNMAIEKAYDLAEIRQNFEIVKQQFNLEKIYYASQIHTDTIFSVDKNSPILECDALMTQEKGLGLLMMHADCQIACFYDPVKKVVATAHAGWRGNIKRLYTKTISRMKEKFQSHPCDILVAISPSLGPQFSEFCSWAKEWPPEFWHHIKEPFHIDLWEIAQEELLSAGILSHHLQIARICTYENKDDFFSFRRKVHEQGPCIVRETGATFISLS